MDRKIQLELALPTEKECKEEEKNTDNVEVVANADIRNKYQHFSSINSLFTFLLLNIVSVTFHPL